MPAGVSTTMAHEMGHNFGFQHDNEITGPCQCGNPPAAANCIMNSQITSVLFFNTAQTHPHTHTHTHTHHAYTYTRITRIV